MKDYQKYDPLHYAEVSMNFLTQMTDPAQRNLPYWLIDLECSPARAQHCRVDDAEICASWAEAILLLREMLGKEAGKDVLNNLIDITLDGFHDDGLHYNNPYPWTDHIFASMHEQAYIASFLANWYAVTGSPVAKEKMDGLIRGLKAVASEKKLVTFWGGTYEQPRKSYFFQGDAIYDGIGFDLSKTRGSGEEPTRNHPMVAALMQYHELTGSEEALDLAEGLINYSVIESHLFSYKGNFSGHVHTHLWIAIGLARLARVKGDETLKQTARDIYEYGQKISSTFGFVPEFGHFNHEGHITSESCCIKDMIELAFEMIRLGYDEWDLIDRFARNQLVENQFQSGNFLDVDEDTPDTQEETFRRMDQRIVGGFTGHAEPNSIPVTNRRAIAGCCSGIAPQAHYLVWKNTVTQDGDTLRVNLFINHTGPLADVACAYPNEGKVTIALKESGQVKIRIPEWAGERITLKRNGVQIPCMWEDNYLVVPDGKAGESITVLHALQDEEKVERVAGTDYTVTWRGSTVVKLLPEGKPYRLYVRDPAYQSAVLFDKGQKKSRVIKATEHQ